MEKALIIIGKTLATIGVLYVADFNNLPLNKKAILIIFLIVLIVLNIQYGKIG